MKKFMGIDVGSSSVKVAITDNNNKLLDSVYLKNKGIIDSLKEAFKLINNNYEISSVGCTGSGREFVKVLVGGDLIKTEILAHTVGAINYYPDVSTIFEIGSEDSKLITLNKGNINNFIMNNMCAGGTGALLDSIANRLNIQIEDYGKIALQSKINLNFPGKCGVFATSSLVSRLNKGANKSDILMGICRALINNYLSMAKSVKLKPPFVFQGATAKNKALVKVLQEKMKHKVRVHKYCELMGAIGMSLLAKSNQPKQTNFRGFEIIDNDFNTETKICDLCDNHCEITKIEMNGKTLSYLNSRCGRY